LAISHAQKTPKSNADVQTGCQDNHLGVYSSIDKLKYMWKGIGVKRMTGFIETYLHKPVAAIEYSDFLAFYNRKLDEGQTLEYKSGELLTGYQDKYISNGRYNKDAAKDDFIKFATSIAGLANAEGGLFVLGVKEVPDKDDSGLVIGKRPGATYPIPSAYIPKEMIADKLTQLVQFPLDNLTILPLRIPENDGQYICLIDVPASTRIPHRVNEKDYPQRKNFTTHLLAHFQINDLFYKRFAPELDVLIEPRDFTDDSFKIRLIIRNSGRAIAKYPFCLVNITEGPYTISSSGGAGWGTQNSQTIQYSLGQNGVIYTALPHDTGLLALTSTTTPPSKAPLTLRFITCAEDAPAKEITLYIDPRIPGITGDKVVSPWLGPFHNIGVQQ
jgi:hypothetical protein